MAKGRVIYDAEWGHVCTCSEITEYDEDGFPIYSVYKGTVTADKDSATESGSYWYSCAVCGAGAWSGM